MTLAGCNFTVYIEPRKVLTDTNISLAQEAADTCLGTVLGRSDQSRKVKMQQVIQHKWAWPQQIHDGPVASCRAQPERDITVERGRNRYTVQLYY